MFHEHQRLDRDAHVTIYMDRAYEEAPFVKLPEVVMETYETPYDYGSLMHFHAYVSTGYYKNEDEKGRHSHFTCPKGFINMFASLKAQYEGC